MDNLAPVTTDPAVPTKAYVDTFNEVYVGTSAPAGTTFDLWIDTNPATGAMDPVRGTAVTNTAGGWANTCYVDKQGAMCTLILNCSKTTWGAGETVLTLPIGFRPAQTLYFPVVNASSGVISFVNMQASGIVVTGMPGTSQGGVLGNLTFFTPY